MNRKKIYFFLLFYLAPVIDSLSGFLILSGSLSDSGSAFTPSQFFRIIIIAFSFYIIKKNRKIFFYNVVFLAYLVFIEIISFFLHQLPYGFIIGITWATKLIYLSLIFSVLYIFYQQGKLHISSFLWNIRNNILISSVLLLLTVIFSVGYSTYVEGTFGSKGFFASGNGLGLYLGTGLLLSIYFWNLKPSTNSYISVLIIITALLFIGTKTALIFSITGAFIMIYLAKKSIISLLLIATVTTYAFIYIELLIDSFTVIFDVILYRFENNDSLEGYLFSGRDVKFNNALNEYDIDGFFLLRLLTGFGAFLSYHDPSLYSGVLITMESDFSDLFFMYGAAGLFAYIFIYLYMAYKTRKDKFLVGILSIWFLGSLFVGHALFNGMSGVLFSLMLILGVLKNNSLSRS